MNWLTAIVVAATILGVALWVWNAIAARTYRSRLADAARDYRSALADGYDNLEFTREATEIGREGKQLMVALGQLGFEPIASQLTRDDRLLVVLHSESERSVAEIVDFTNLAGTERFVVEFTSVLEGNRGLLCTNNTATQSIHDDELRQTFLEATPAELARHHQAAMEYLRGKGLNIEPVPRDEALATRARWVGLHQQNVQGAPMQTVLDWLRDVQGGYSTSSGPIADSPTMRERLHAIIQRD